MKTTIKKLTLNLDENRIKDLINFLGVQKIEDTRNIIEKYDLDSNEYYTDETLDIIYYGLEDLLK